MDCPKCKDRSLAALRDVPIDGASCSRCGGIWVADEAAIGAVPPVEVPAPRAASDRADDRGGLCPNGHGLLTRARTHVEDGFFLERCATCHGIWFDHGEWQRIAAAGLASGLASGLLTIWSEDWQRQQRREAARSAHRAELEAKLGRERVARIEALARDLDGHPARSLALGFLLSRLRGDADASL